MNYGGDEFDDFDDTTTPAPASGGNGLDASYREQFGSGTGDEIAPRQAAAEAVPAFPYYVVKPVKAVGGFSGEKGSPKVNVTVEVLEGPDGTVGRKVYDSMGIYFLSNRTSKDRKTGEQVQLTEAKFQEKVAKRKAMLNRVAATLKLACSVPPNFTQDGLDAYAAGFNENAPSFVVEIRQDKRQDGSVWNKIQWESIAALDEPVKDARGRVVPGETALSEARKKIAARASGGKRGRTAGSVGRPATPQA